MRYQGLRLVLAAAFCGFLMTGALLWRSYQASLERTRVATTDALVCSRVHALVVALDSIILNSTREASHAAYYREHPDELTRARAQARQTTATLTARGDCRPTNLPTVKGTTTP